MPEVLAEVLPGRPIAMLSGPSFAEEVVRGLPTAVSIATADPALGQTLAGTLAAGAFRPYWTHDVLGVALGGAVKNVLAIAAGVVEGRGLGHNATAALITRGFAEMARLGQAMGAELETLAGLSGLGDLVLTCHGPLSRNRSLGEALGTAARTSTRRSALCWRGRCGAKENERRRSVTWRIGSSSPSRRPIRGTSSSRTRRPRGPACATPRPRSTSRP
jgi:glycerol-3-phosphate dehydrogenase